MYCKMKPNPIVFWLFCRSSSPTIYKDAWFGQSNGTSLNIEPDCKGSEVDLAFCPLNKEWGNETCSHSDDAGVACYPTALGNSLFWLWKSSVFPWGTHIIVLHRFSVRNTQYRSLLWGTHNIVLYRFSIRNTHYSSLSVFHQKHTISFSIGFPSGTHTIVLYWFSVRNTQHSSLSVFSVRNTRHRSLSVFLEEHTISFSIGFQWGTHNIVLYRFSVRNTQHRSLSGFFREEHTTSFSISFPWGTHTIVLYRFSVKNKQYSSLSVFLEEHTISFSIGFQASTTCDYRTVTTLVTVGWRCTTMVTGALSVWISGTRTTPMWSAKCCITSKWYKIVFIYLLWLYVYMYRLLVFFLLFRLVPLMAQFVFTSIVWDLSVLWFICIVTFKLFLFTTFVFQFKRNLLPSSTRGCTCTGQLYGMSWRWNRRGILYGWSQERLPTKICRSGLHRCEHM